MALTTSGLDYIARNFGIGNCWVGSGLSWVSVDHDGNRSSESGGTKSIVGRLINDTVYARIELTSPRTGTYTKSDLISGNNGQSITLPDVKNADPTYCVGEAPTPTVCTPGDTRCHRDYIQTCKSDGSGWETTSSCPYGCEVIGGVPRCKDAPVGCTPGTRRCVGDRVEECNTSREWVYVRTCAYGCSGAGICNAAPGEPGEQPETGPFEVYVGGSAACPAGSPTVTLDTTDAFAYFKADPAIYVGVMNIMVKHIHDECYAYFTWEMRMWDGAAGTTCPTTTPEKQEISRFLAKVSPKKVITLKRIDAGATEMVSGSFEIPAHYKGKKTICLSLWGDYSYDELVSDLAAEGYAKEITW